MSIGMLEITTWIIGTFCSMKYSGVFLTLKAPITTTADDIHKYFFIVLCFAFAGQRIHMKNQALFSLKDKSKKWKFRLLQFLCGI